MKKGDAVRVIRGGTVTSGGIILKVFRRAYLVKHYHGETERLAKENVRPAL